MKTWTKVAAIGGGVLAVVGAVAAVFTIREHAVEQPEYTRVEADDPIEVRDYPALLVAETLTSGERDKALQEGFRRLARFIFGKERGDGASDEAIAMTAPVLQDRASGRWRTRFVMPRGFNEATLPAPPAGVGSDMLDARRVAAIKFSGLAGDEALRTHERTLREWLVTRGYEPVGAAEYAFYNSPMIAPPLRRNEVLIPIRR